jgi:hypothetical protein
LFILTKQVPQAIEQLAISSPGPQVAIDFQPGFRNYANSLWQGFEWVVFSEEGLNRE